LRINNIVLIYISNMNNNEDDFTEEDGIFISETAVLHHSQNIILNRNRDPQVLFSEYERLSSQYSKLLRLTKKLVRMGDNTQKKLLETNELVQEKVTLLTKAEEKLKELSVTDTLTQLYNRRGTYQCLNALEKQYRDNEKTFALFLIDIDFFKKVNDTFGHNAGDLVLIKLAELMRNSLRKQDCLGRWGGEEFILILPDTDAAGAIIIAEKMRKIVDSHSFGYNEATIKVTISLGGCCHKQNMEVSQCLELADQALYRSKTGGRNKVELHEY
jgi:diguanylate cyclase (GGDEF)-like protein